MLACRSCDRDGQPSVCVRQNSPCPSPRSGPARGRREAHGTGALSQASACPGAAHCLCCGAWCRCRGPEDMGGEGTCCPGASALCGQMCLMRTPAMGTQVTQRVYGHLPGCSRLACGVGRGKGHGICRFRLCGLCERGTSRAVRGTSELPGPPPARWRAPAGAG